MWITPCRPIRWHEFNGLSVGECRRGTIYAVRVVRSGVWLMSPEGNRRFKTVARAKAAAEKLNSKV